MVRFLRPALILSSLLVMVSCQKGTSPQATNILIIHTDQHRIDCLGAYGNTDIQTPHLDQLAQDGILYYNSYCTLPVCTPSRYSLLTGQYVHEHQGWTNRSTLNPAIQTLPDILKMASFRTKAVGKMHFTPTYLDVGFEELILAEQDGEGRWDDDYHRALMQHKLVDAIDLEDQRQEYRRNAPASYWSSFGTASTHLPDAFYSTTWIAKQALADIEKWGNTNNFLMVGFIKPHHPFDPPQQWVDLYDPTTLSLLPGWLNQPIGYDTLQHRGYFPNSKLRENALRKSMAYYYASISQIDHEVGRMIQVLKEKGLYDNTLIIFTSDHGEHLGYHHQLLKGGYLYESIMKVPLLIKFPEQQNAGSSNTDLVSNIDIAPTILQSVGIDIPQEMSGQNLGQNNPKRNYLFGHAWLGNQAMARSEQFKYIWTKNGKDLFFDLKKDPLELNNLIAEPTYQSEIANHLQAIHDWQGTDSLIAQNHLDLNAPLIVQPNVRSHKDGHRDSVIAYFQRKMEAYQNEGIRNKE